MLAGVEAQGLRFLLPLFGPGFEAHSTGGQIGPVWLDIGVAVVALAGMAAGPGQRNGLVVGLGEGLSLVLGDEDDPLGHAEVVGEGGGNYSDGQSTVGQ